MEVQEEVVLFKNGEWLARTEHKQVTRYVRHEEYQTQYPNNV